MGINLLRKGLRHREVFLILDDVDHINQLKALVGEESFLGPGSRVIIINREKQMLRAFGLPKDNIYEVGKLTDNEALQLLCQKAFKKNYASDEYRGLSNSFVKYCGGLPLALVVLGSHLYRRKVDEWSAALARLDKHSDNGIFHSLILSYDGLQETEKEIFLDIACFFRGESQYRVQKILEGCGFFPDIGIPVLIDKNLIKIEEDKVCMHDLLQQMGWNIVRQESPEPGKRSRLWLNENSHEYQHSSPWFDKDTRDVVTENLGTFAVQGISLSVLDKEERQLKADPFLNMRKLRLLKICNVNLLDVRFENLSNKVRLLEWHECPLESLPSSYQPDKLVELKLPNSRIETLWNQRLCLEKLIPMDLSYCQYLVKTPDFSNFPNLEELTFEGCEKLSDVHPTLWRLKNLKVVNLKDCTSLERLPKSISLISLATLILSGCSKLDEFPVIVGNRGTLSALYLDGTAIKELPTTFRCLRGLIKLSLCACKNLVGLPSFISSLKSLRNLRLSYSSRVDQLPEDIWSLENLEKLDACYTAIRKVPSSIVLLKNLKSLCFQGCRQVPGECSDKSFGLQLPKSFSGMSSLETLYLGQCDLAEGAIPDDIGCLSSLKHLRLDENNFVSIPESISQLPNLREIHIPNCSKLQYLPKRLPKDVNVESSGCPLLTNYPNPLGIWLSDEEVPAAASSSSASTLEHDVVSHDVFLSFGDEDTGYGFTDHLYHAMNQQRIIAFRETEKLERGHLISYYLLKAIKASRIAVIILSANYATSTWCLEELALIVECQKSRGLKVLPVFYHVEPSEVRKQTGNFGEALCKHEETFINNMGKVRKWRDALTRVANISGWDLKGRGESEVIQTITTEISKTLHSINKHLIGMDARIETLMSYLDLKSNDVRTIGIAGMGGIGKSTLAKAVFEEIRFRFESSCFIADVTRKSPVELQKLLCQQFQLDSHASIQNEFMGFHLLRKGLRHEKVLIILDNVDQIAQLAACLGKPYCLGRGSRVIVTTRDTHMLKAFGLLEDEIYEVEKLTDKESLQLLCQKAFKENHCPDEYRGLSNSFIKYASGLPIVLEVLGSDLCTRTVNEWSALLARLDKDPQKDIFPVLEISYDGLEETEKEIFLGIACFFRGESQYRVKQIFKSCDFEPDIGIRRLVEKHLIKIEEDKLWMHDLLQQMGWHIVRRESPEPGKRSRLWLNENSHEYQHRSPWFDEDTRDVVTENLGTIAVKGVYLSVLVKEEIRLKADPFLNMGKLRLLKICNVNLLDVRFEYLSNKLRCLEWHECPLESLPSSFRPDKLVELKLPNSRIETVWNQRLCLEKLILMDLSYCQYLVKTPDFSNFPNLEELTFEGCRKLSDVHPTLWRLKNLKVAIFQDCTSLESLPNSISFQSLAILVLSGCSNLDEFPEIVGNGETLSALYLDGTAIRELPTSIGCLSSLIRLNLCACKNLVGLPSFICSLKSLRYLRLSYSSRIGQLPEDIGSLENLEKLDACYTAIRKVPSSIVLLKKLKSLCLQGCRQVPGECSDESLGLQLPESFSGLSSLETLYLGQCDLAEGAIPDDIGCLSSLKHIRLDESNFVSIPESISQLPKLREIHIPNCSKLQSLPNRLPEDVNVEASGCPLLRNYPNQLNIWLSDDGISHINCGSEHASYPLPIPEEQIEKFYPKYLEDLIVRQQHLQLRFFHTRIPDWCRHKSSGSSIAMQVSDLEIIKSLGVALFFVFEIFESGQNFDESWELQRTFCTFKDDQGVEHIFIFRDFEKFRAGTHVSFCYEPRKYFQIAGMLNKASRFEASVSTERPDLEIKSCGMQLIFQEEAAKFAQNLSEASNPTTDFDFGRHCKELIRNSMGKESSGNVMVPNEAEKVSWKFDFNMHPTEDLQLLLSKLYEDFNGDIIYNATYPHCAKLLEWFGDHTRDPSVKIQLPPSLSSYGNWIGLALCARFSDLENQATSIDKVNPEIAELVCHLKTENNSFEHLHHYRPTNQEFKRLCHTEFIWLSYIPRQGYLDQLNECDLLEASFASESPGLFAEVCGLRLVYQQGEQEFKDLCIFMNSLLNERSERLEEHEAPKKGKKVLEFDFNMHPREDLQLLLSVLYEGPYGREKEFGLFFPHKVVPFWFFHHYAGNVALCDFPLGLSDDQRWIGLELFVIVSSHYSINVESLLDVDLCSDEISKISTSVMINTSLGSDQLVLIHIPRLSFPEQLNQCHGISALFRTATPDMGVQMCGSRLLYEQDLEDLIQARTVCTLGSQDVIDSLCQQIQQLLGSYLPVDPFDHVAAVEITVEQKSVEAGEKDIGRKNDHSSTEREDLIQDPREQVFTSILHNYSSYLQQKHGCIESKRIISHSEGYLLDNGDPKPVFTPHHLHVMVETRLYGSLSSEDWKRSLESLLQYFKVATLSVKGQMIAVLNPFTPSSVNNFCFPRKELPVWFWQQTRVPRIRLTENPCDDENWLGLAICATFSVHEHPSVVLDNLATRTCNVMCHLAALDGRCLSPAPVFTITKEKFKWIHLRGFMWLAYIPRSYLTEFREVHVAEARIYNDCPGLMMTRWSIRHLFKQDVKEFNKAIVQCWTSFFDNLDLIRQFVEADENEQSHYSDRGETSTSNRGETSTSKILMPKGHVKGFNGDFIYNASYPHCFKLLEWFGDHTRGPSVKIQLPPFQSSYGNWIGLALCARISDLENQTTSIGKVNPEIAELVCLLETENTSSEHLHHYRPTNEEFKRLRSTEFIWLSYMPRQGYLNQLNKCNLLEASFASESPGLFAEQCALRLVYQHDEQEFKDLCIFMNSLLDKKSEILEEHEAPMKGKQLLQYPEPEIELGSNAMWNLEIYNPKRKHW